MLWGQDKNFYCVCILLYNSRTVPELLIYYTSIYKLVFKVCAYYKEDLKFKRMLWGQGKNFYYIYDLFNSRPVLEVFTYYMYTYIYKSKICIVH